MSTRYDTVRNEIFMIRDVTEFESKCCQILAFFAKTKFDTFLDSFAFGFSFHFGNCMLIICHNPPLAIQK